MLPDLQENNSRAYEIVSDEVPVIHNHERLSLELPFEPRLSLLYSTWHVALDITSDVTGHGSAHLPGFAWPDLLQPGAPGVSRQAVSYL